MIGDLTCPRPTARRARCAHAPARSWSASTTGSRSAASTTRCRSTTWSPRCAGCATHAADLGVDADRISVGGASAGGNLATGAVLRLRDEDGWQPAVLIPVYGVFHAVLPADPPRSTPLLAEVPDLLRFTAGVDRRDHRELPRRPAGVRGRLRDAGPGRPRRPVPDRSGRRGVRRPAGVRRGRSPRAWPRPGVRRPPSHRARRAARLPQPARPRSSRSERSSSSWPTSWRRRYRSRLSEEYPDDRSHRLTASSSSAAASPAACSPSPWASAASRSCWSRPRSELGGVGHGITLQGNALKAFDSVGIYDELAERGFAFNHLRMSTADGHVIAEIPTPPMGGPTCPARWARVRADIADILAEERRGGRRRRTPRHHGDRHRRPRRLGHRHPVRRHRRDRRPAGRRRRHPLQGPRR